MEPKVVVFRTNEENEAKAALEILLRDGLQAEMQMRSATGESAKGREGSEENSPERFQISVPEPTRERARKVLWDAFGDTDEASNSLDRFIGRKKARVPIMVQVREAKITACVILVCGIIFAVINLERLVLGTGAALAALSSNLISYWNGSLWVILTSGFTHENIIHFVFNMSWAWVLGTRIENSIRPAKYLALICVTAVISYGLFVLVKQQSAIGYSGVIYGLAGYASIAGYKREPALILRNEQWILGVWLIAAIALTRLELLPVANWGHIGGLLAGLAMGWAFTYRGRRHWAWLPAGVLLIASATSLYMPWSEAWLARKELAEFGAIVNAARSGDIEARAQYGSYLTKSPDSVEEGAQMLRESAEAGSVEGMNGYAWYLATNPLRSEFEFDEVGAVGWALRACEATGFSNWAIVDTLAAAYAASEEWDEAIRYQQKAVDMVSAEELSGARARLALYESHLPYIDEMWE